MTFSTPSVTMTSTSGRYSGNGVDYTVTGTANYYLYVQDPTSYIWYRKGQLSSSGILTDDVNIGKNETGATYYTHLVLSSDDMNLSTTLGNDVLNYALPVSVPLYICQIYEGSSAKTTYNNVTNPSLKLELSRSDCDEVYGLSTAANTVATISSSSLSNGWSYFGPNVNGKTLYTIYKNYSTSSSPTKYYYRGSNSRKSVKVTITTTYEYLYGTGSTKNGSTSMSLGSMTTTCLSDTSYGLIGWTYDVNSTKVQYNTAAEAFSAYDTIYGIYEKEGSTTTTPITYYRGGGTPYSTTRTKIISSAYYYGIGYHSPATTTYNNGAYNESCEVSGWTHIGWAADENVESSTSTINELLSAGYTTIYGTYSETQSMRYYPEIDDSSNYFNVDVTNYRYGIGSVTNNIPTEPNLTYDGHTFINWASMFDPQGTPLSWSQQWNDGVRIVYAVWRPDSNIYLGINGEWILCQTYIGMNGEWVPIQMKYGYNNNWN